MAAGASSSARPGFLFLICPDAQLLIETIEEKAQQYAPGGAAFKRLTFWGDEAPDNTFWEALAVRDLFGSMRLVLVRQANLWQAAAWKMLDKMLARPLGGSWPVFCLEVDWDRGKPRIPAVIAKTRCFDFAKKQGWTWMNQGVTDYTVYDYVQSQARARNLRLAPPTLERLCADTPRQAGVLSAELDKLALLSDGTGEITPDMLGTADWSPDAQVFTCVSCLISGDARGVWREIGRTLDMDAAAFSLLGLINWQLRTLWQLMAGDQAKSFGKLTQATAQRIGPERLARAMNMVMEAESSIKTGSQPRQTVEFLCSSLLRLFAAR